MVIKVNKPNTIRALSVLMGSKVDEAEVLANKHLEIVADRFSKSPDIIDKQEKKYEKLLASLAKVDKVVVPLCPKGNVPEFLDNILVLTNVLKNCLPTVARVDMRLVSDHIQNYHRFMQLSADRYFSEDSKDTDEAKRIKEEVASGLEDFFLDESSFVIAKSSSDQLACINTDSNLYKLFKQATDDVETFTKLAINFINELVKENFSDQDLKKISIMPWLTDDNLSSYENAHQNVSMALTNSISPDYTLRELVRTSTELFFAVGKTGKEQRNLSIKTLYKECNEAKKVFDLCVKAHQVQVCASFSVFIESSKTLVFARSPGPIIKWLGERNESGGGAKLSACVVDIDTMPGNLMLSRSLPPRMDYVWLPMAMKNALSGLTWQFCSNHFQSMIKLTCASSIKAKYQCQDIISSVCTAALNIGLIYNAALIEDNKDNQAVIANIIAARRDLTAIIASVIVLTDLGSVLVSLSSNGEDVTAVCSDDILFTKAIKEAQVQAAFRHIKMSMFSTMASSLPNLTLGI